jgi:hypothetical protein
MLNATMRCDPETGDTYFLAPIGADQLQLVDEIEAATQWMAQCAEDQQMQQILRAFDAEPFGAPVSNFDLDFSASFSRPRAN